MEKRNSINEKGREKGEQSQIKKINEKEQMRKREGKQGQGKKKKTKRKKGK